MEIAEETDVGGGNTEKLKEIALDVTEEFATTTEDRGFVKEDGTVEVEGEGGRDGERKREGDRRKNRGEGDAQGTEDEQDVVTEAEEDVAPTSKGIQAIIDSIDEYTDKHMMVSMWSWNPKDVAPG